MRAKCCAPFISRVCLSQFLHENVVVKKKLHKNVFYPVSSRPVKTCPVFTAGFSAILTCLIAVTEVLILLMIFDTRFATRMYVERASAVETSDS